MAKQYAVEITVKAITQSKGCAIGHKPGDTWLVKENKTPDGICLGAFNALLPALKVFRCGGEHHFDKDRDVTCVSCPDRNVQVIWELRRLRSD